MNIKELKLIDSVIAIKDKEDLIKAAEILDRIGISVFSTKKRKESFIKNDDKVKNYFLIQDEDGRFRTQSHYLGSGTSTEKLEKEVNEFLGNVAQIKIKQSSIKKIKKEKSIFHKIDYKNPIPFRLYKHLIEDCDIVHAGHEEAYYGSDSSMESHFYLTVTRMVLETDEEFEERKEENRKIKEKYKEKRYQSYLKLKEEFEIDENTNQTQEDILEKNSIKLNTKSVLYRVKTNEEVYGVLITAGKNYPMFYAYEAHIWIKDGHVEKNHTPYTNSYLKNELIDTPIFMVEELYSIVKKQKIKKNFEPAILTDEGKIREEIEELKTKIHDWDELAKDNDNNMHNFSTSERQDWADRLNDLNDYFC